MIPYKRPSVADQSREGNQAQTDVCLSADQFVVRAIELNWNPAHQATDNPCGELYKFINFEKVVPV
jgi:hypothetical protein